MKQMLLPLLFFVLLFSLNSSPLGECSCKTDSKNTPVLISIIARNKGYLLRKFFQCIEKLEYNKKKIIIRINSYNNSDDTQEILLDWVSKNRSLYKAVELGINNYPTIPMQKLYLPIEVIEEELDVIAQLKSLAIQKAKESECEYCFLLDCEALIAPLTLSHLIEKEKPVIAPMLRAIPEFNDLNSTFFYAIDDKGYYLEHPQYLRILFHWNVGTMRVPLVSRAVLIKKEFFDKFPYSNKKGEYDHIVFSRHLREKSINQYICNEHSFGVLISLTTPNISFDDQKLKLQTLLLMP